jgi:hypothetical protein
VVRLSPAATAYSIADADAYSNSGRQPCIYSYRDSYTGANSHYDFLA